MKKKKRGGDGDIQLYPPRQKIPQNSVKTTFVTYILDVRIIDQTGIFLMTK